MMETKLPDNVLRAIIREVLMEGTKRGLSIDKHLVSHMVKFSMLNPSLEIEEDQTIDKEDIYNIVNLCLENMKDENSPALSTIRMQVLYKAYYQTRSKQIDDNRTNVKKRTAPLVKEIIHITPRSKDELERLYRKLVIIIILKSGLGNPTHALVLKEATAALQSVFPPTELGQFCALDHEHKQQQIHELTQIVTGIRLFNRDCQKGGEGIEDLPNLLQETNSATIRTIETYLNKLMPQIYTLTSAVEQYILQYILLIKDDTQSVDPEIEKSITDPDSKTINLMKGCLVTARQQEFYMRKFLDDAMNSSAEITFLLDHLKARLIQIHDTVRFRTAVPTVTVYPQFIDLAEVWGGLQDEMVILSNLNNIMYRIQHHIQVLNDIDMQMIKYLIGNKPILTDEERAAVPCERIERSENATVAIINPLHVNMDIIKPRFRGFCSWALVAGDGALIPGNGNIGLIQYNDHIYTCGATLVAQQFADNPDRFIWGVVEIGRKQPELIDLLDLHDMLETKLEPTEEAASETALILKHDIGMQTELHPIPPQIDRKYTWEMWKLRRRALQLTTIASSATHSTQTTKSNFRMSVGLQANCPKDVGSQTKHDNSSNVPTLSTYLFGLQGRTDDKQFVIHLTRPVNE